MSTDPSRISKKEEINLRYVNYLSSSRDSEYFQRFTNIQDWWNFTLRHGKQKTDYHLSKVNDYLNFSENQIQKIITDVDFRRCHQMASLYEWHSGYHVHHSDGAHRMAHVVTMCRELAIDVYYPMEVSYHFIVQENLNKLVDEFSIYFLFHDDRFDLSQTMSTFINSNYKFDNQIESYILTPQHSSNNVKYLFIKKEKKSKNLCQVLDQQINSNNDFVALLCHMRSSPPITFI